MGFSQHATDLAAAMHEVVWPLDAERDPRVGFDRAGRAKGRGHGRPSGRRVGRKLHRDRERQSAGRVDPAAAPATPAARLPLSDDERRQVRPLGYGLTRDILRGADHLVAPDINVVAAPPELGGYVRRLVARLVIRPG